MNSPLVRYILYPKTTKKQAKSASLSKIVLYSPASRGADAGQRIVLFTNRLYTIHT